MSRARFPRHVFEAGTEPDPRFTLANERTFLAWIRTALALVAAGVALEALALPLQPALRFTASMILLALGLVVPTLACLPGHRSNVPSENLHHCRARRSHCPSPSASRSSPHSSSPASCCDEPGAVRPRTPTRTNRTRLASHSPRRDRRRSRRFTTPAAHPRPLVDQRGARRPRPGCPHLGTGPPASPPHQPGSASRPRPVARSGPPTSPRRCHNNWSSLWTAIRRTALSHSQAAIC